MRKRGPPGARSALDLIEEHLTDNSTEALYRQGVQGGVLVKSWFFPEDWKGAKEGQDFVLKVQPFAKGGYEATVRAVDLEKIGNAMLGGGVRGKREVPDVVPIDNQMKAAAGSKRKMRHLVKNMMADHLVTFTKREAEGSRYWTADQWAAAWDRFRRMLVRVIGEFPYVAILEKHEKGSYRLHVAWCGRVNVGIVRKMCSQRSAVAKGAGTSTRRKSRSHAAAIGLRGSRGTFRSTCPNISRTIRATTKSGIGPAGRQSRMPVDT